MQLSAACEMSWQPVPEDRRVGICIYNYTAGQDCHVPAYIGDKLHIFEAEQRSLQEQKY